MRTFRIAAALAIALAATAARAQVDRPYYVGLRLGVFSPQHSDLDGYGSGFAAEVAVGSRFMPNLAGEVAVGNYRAGFDGPAYDATGGVYTLKSTLSMTPITATAKLLLPLGPFEPYGLIGAGAYLASMDWDDGYSRLTSSSTTFGVHVGAGLGILFAPQATLGVEVRYVMASPRLFDQTWGTDGLQITGAASFRF
jgi:opacity protein-like surface antigen